MADIDFTPDELKNEQWRDVPGYEGLYQVSNLGRVKSLARISRNQYSAYQKAEKLLAARKVSYGYTAVVLYRRSEKRQFRIHRLVLMAFDRLPESDEQGNHIDGDKRNNRLTNLEWVSPSGNVKHAYDNGLNCTPSGEKNPMAKLTTEQVKQARALYRRGVRGYGAHVLAKRYGVSKPAMRRVLNGESYRDN